MWPLFFTKISENVYSVGRDKKALLIHEKSIFFEKQAACACAVVRQYFMPVVENAAKKKFKFFHSRSKPSSLKKT